MERVSKGGWVVKSSPHANQLNFLFIHEHTLPRRGDATTSTPDFRFVRGVYTNNNRRHIAFFFRAGLLRMHNASVRFCFRRHALGGFALLAELQGRSQAGADYICPEPAMFAKSVIG